MRAPRTPARRASTGRRTRPTRPHAACTTRSRNARASSSIAGSWASHGRGRGPQPTGGTVGVRRPPRDRSRPMNLETASALSQFVGTATIVGGTVFALVQLAEIKKQRRDGVAGELMRSFMDAEFANALTIIRGLPDGVSAEELRLAGPEAERAAVLICTTFETMGLLVFQR